jgi:hypothetical protein
VEFVFGRKAVLQMKLAGASAPAQVEGLDRLPGKVNYFISNDPSRWLAGIPTYARVQYHQVYPGIDLIFYGRQGQLEYDFLVAQELTPAISRWSSMDASAYAWMGAAISS